MDNQITIKCPKCGHSFTPTDIVSSNETKALLKECREFLRQAISDEPFSTKSKEEHQRILDWFKRIDELN